MGRRKQSLEAVELDLLPIMNMMSIMIPMLLMSAEFVTLSVIDSSLPAIGPSEAQGLDEPALNLTLALTSRGLTLLGADAVLHPSGAPAPGADGQRAPTIPCRSGGICQDAEDYDWEALSEMLGRIKDEYPSEDSIVLVPDSRIRYEVIVRAMDSSRESASQLDEDGGRRSLFPQAVIAGGAVN